MTLDERVRVWRDGRLVSPKHPGICVHHVGTSPGLWCGACNEGAPMADLLEDPDGAPYPEEVQEFWRSAVGHDLGDVEIEAVRQDFIDALEAVAKAAREGR